MQWQFELFCSIRVLVSALYTLHRDCLTFSQDCFTNLPVHCDAQDAVRVWQRRSERELGRKSAAGAKAGVAGSDPGDNILLNTLAT